MNSIRIIAGIWGSRKLKFPDIKGLRPTPDRSRETIFNWLQGDIANATCLDLFAGSGALGIEALSRGATAVHLVEKKPKAFRSIKDNLKTLRAENFKLYNLSALKIIPRLETKFDIIFLDPPFSSNLLAQSLDLIIQSAIIRKDSLLVIETEQRDFSYQVNAVKLEIIKTAHAGDSNIYLVRL